MRTAETIEQTKESSGNPAAENTPESKPRKGNRDASRIAAWRWKPGQSGNPGGRPKNDVAKEVAQAIFENNAEGIYKAGTKALLKGNAYAFDVLANRAYGKLKETQELGDRTLAVLEKLSAGRKRAQERNGK